ncbi:macro domain-containing protein [Bradyrhizobium ottawaense]|uniref:macro domain-containing protein n=1 Tax=Bradyrhizobium ottawaense TaxID=931866 RepID=UPI003850DBAF
MIRFTQGNLLDSDAQALVNTVNTVGVMGKGVALMFKEAFPENFTAYEAACRSDGVQIGKMRAGPANSDSSLSGFSA